jgi:hypothetical protein
LLRFSDRLHVVVEVLGTFGKISKIAIGQVAERGPCRAWRAR